MATTAELEARIRELEEKLRAMESDRDGTMRNVLDEVFPRESRRDMRNAWKEQLLAVRSALDHWIERQDENAETKRRESIRVE